MNLKEASKKLEGAKELKARYEERLKALKRALSDKKEELKELGVDSIEDIDKELAEKTKKLKGYIKKIDSLQEYSEEIEGDVDTEEEENEIEELLDI